MSTTLQQIITKISNNYNKKIIYVSNIFFKSPNINISLWITILVHPKIVCGRNHQKV